MLTATSAASAVKEGGASGSGMTQQLRKAVAACGEGAARMRARRRRAVVGAAGAC
jgi:hypothetical protein